MSYVCLPAILIPGDFNSIEEAAAEIAQAARSLLYGPDNPVLAYPNTGYGRPVSRPAQVAKVLCYAQAAVNSALQMVRDLNRARLHAGQLALTPLSHWFNLKCDEYPAECAGFFANSESYYLFGNQGYCYGDPAHPARLGLWCLGETSGAGWYHPGFIYLSELQLVRDDVSAQDATQAFEPVRSPEGILPYPPSRLAQVALTDTYNALRHTEENALGLLAQSEPPALVAKISTSETVTDPIGRLVLGETVQVQLGGAFPGTLPGVGQASRLTPQLPGSGGTPDLRSPAAQVVHDAAVANGERQPVLPGGTGSGGTPDLPTHTNIG